MNNNELLAKIEEIEKCIMNIKNASNDFNDALEIVNKAEFFQIGSSIDTYNKFKELNKFPDSYCNAVDEYLDGVKGSSN